MYCIQVSEIDDNRSFFLHENAKSLAETGPMIDKKARIVCIMAPNA